MNKSSLKLNIIKIFVATMTLAAPSFAATIQVNSVTGAWQNVQGGAGVVFPVPNEVRWGTVTPTSAKSGYRFDGDAPPLFPVTIDVPFSLGLMTNYNQPIPSGSGIDSADLKTTVNMTIDGNPINNLHFTYTFLHDETPNIPGSCPVGSSSVCDDIEKLLNNTAQSDTFNIGGVDYTIKVIGFQIGNQQASQWLTPEGGTNNAHLLGIVTKSIRVPEPATYLLLGSTILVAMVAMRRKKCAVKI